MGGLHLPHWKVEALASCTPNDDAHLRYSVYWMYLSGTNALVNVLVHGGGKQKNNSTHRLNVEWQGTWNGSRVELPGDPFCTAAWLQKGMGDMTQGLLYQRIPS